MAQLLDQLVDLSWTRPGLDASDAETAAWLERKAAVWDEVAGSGVPDAVLAAGWAREAHRHAARLLGSGVAA
jgi:hypothetical protein